MIKKGTIFVLSYIACCEYMAYGLYQASVDIDIDTLIKEAVNGNTLFHPSDTTDDSLKMEEIEEKVVSYIEEEIIKRGLATVFPQKEKIIDIRIEHKKDKNTNKGDYVIGFDKQYFTIM